MAAVRFGGCFFGGFVYNILVAQRCLRYPGVAQLVGRLVWDQDAASSSLATRTKIPKSTKVDLGILL